MRPTEFARVATMVCVTLLCAGEELRADIRPPEVVNKKSKLTIVSNSQSGKSYLILPRRLVEGAGQKIGIDGSRTRTIVAGVALSAAAILGGLVMARRRSTLGAIVVTCLIAGALILGKDQFLSADIRPPARPYEPVPKPDAGAHRVLADVEVEIIILDGDDSPILALGNKTKLKTE